MPPQISYFLLVNRSSEKPANTQPKLFAFLSFFCVFCVVFFLANSCVFVNVVRFDLVRRLARFVYVTKQADVLLRIGDLAHEFDELTAYLVQWLEHQKV